MNRITLKFLTADLHVQLEETRFSSPLIQRTVSSRRGAHSLHGTYEGTFIWSAGVMGMSAIFLKAKICSLMSSVRETWTEASGIRSDESDWARAFDSSLAKRPQWLLDMFGLDKADTPVIKRMFVRRNPEKKRPGPVLVFLNTAFLSPENISIFLDGRELVDATSLEELLQRLGFQEDKKLPRSYIQRGAGDAGLDAPPQTGTGRVVIPLRPQGDPVHAPNWMFHMIRREVVVGLQETAIFSESSSKAMLRYLAGYEPFRRIGGSPYHLTSEIDLTLRDSARLGLGLSGASLSRLLSANTPIRILCGVGGVTSLCIFRYLTAVKGYNLEISYNFSSSQDIVHTLRAQGGDDPVDGVVMALCCSVRLCQGKSSFSPLGLMPSTTHARLSRGSDIEQYLFLTDVVTGSHFNFEDERKPLRREVSTCPLPIAGLVEELERHGNSRAILFWPYYVFANNRNDWSIDSDFSRVPAYELVTLCVSRRISTNPDLALALNIAIRDAWLTLRNNSRLVDSMIEALLADPCFVSAFCRLGPEPIMQNAAGW